MHAVAESIRNSNKILTQLWIIIVDVAAVEETDMLLVGILTCLRVAVEPSFKLLSGIFRERAVTVNLEHAVHNHLRWFQTQSEVGQRSNHRGH